MTSRCRPLAGSSSARTRRVAQITWNSSPAEDSRAPLGRSLLITGEPNARRTTSRSRRAQSETQSALRRAAVPACHHMSICQASSIARLPLSAPGIFAEDSPVYLVEMVDQIKIFENMIGIVTALDGEPIPQGQINLMGGSFPQNTGY